MMKSNSSFFKRISFLPGVLTSLCLAVGLFVVGQEPVTAQDASPEPVLMGEVKKHYNIGPLLHRNDFESLDQWSVQVQSGGSDAPEARVRVKNNKLDAFVPGRGATIWYRKKLEGPVAIVYQVRAPKAPDTDGIVPRDINNFWHMSAKPDTLLKTNSFNGGFGSYHELQGYYSSTGGRDNRTTRFRRYPREIRGRSAAHIALNHRDNKDPYLITPGKKHTVQLVAADGTAQYIVDGKLVYEISYGDRVQMKTASGDMKTVRYTRDQFPAYTEGWFGFRLTTTHHIYSNVRIFRLESK